MRTEDFDYPLDESLIAQTPLEKRSDSRLLILNPNKNTIEHRHFYDLSEFLHAGDLLVLNDTRVLPARLFGARPGKDEKIEVLLLERKELSIWETLVRPGKKMKVGTIVEFGELLKGEVLSIEEGGTRRIRFHYDGVFEEILDRLGEMPLPPYIHEKLEDKERYQTVYAREKGSSAAPTAGLHFTEELMDELRARGVEIATLTLHVGLGTFRPVKVEDVTKHHMHSEFYRLGEENAEKILRAKKEGRRVIAVGTTSVRTLETIAHNGSFHATSGWTEIFIYPGFDFRIVDALITNFHLPKSTLMMLVSAFASKEAIMHAYEVAQKEKYRFFSFGDAMFIEEKYHGNHI